MTQTTTLVDLEARIAVVRDNIRELTEQASAYSGATDEARVADRIARTRRPAGPASEGARRPVELGLVALIPSAETPAPRFQRMASLNDPTPPNWSM